MATLELATFQPHEGTTFQIPLASGEPYAVQLVEVKPIQQRGGASHAARQAPFRLTFRHPSATEYLPQQTYVLQHAELGEVAIFLVPIGPDGEGMCYEAIFN